MSERLPTPSPTEGRLTDGLFVVAALAFILLTPPIVTIFDVSVTVFGIPLLHVYCFGVWLIAIIAGRFLSRRMAGTAPDAPHRDPTGG